MCGRFTLKTPASRVAELFDLDEIPPLEPRYNIAPTQLVAAVRLTEQNRLEFTRLRWGLVPSWAKDLSMASRAINARSETVAEKSMFRDAYRKRRCLVIADGYFEWRTVSGEKQPYHIHLADDRPFAFAGLWDRWKPKDGSVVESCTILTQPAAVSLASLHDRMPVIVPQAQQLSWLNTSLTVESLRANPVSDLAITMVSTLVNNVRNDSPECVLPVSEDDAA